jgi:hypothetical protein
MDRLAKIVGIITIYLIFSFFVFLTSCHLYGGLCKLQIIPDEYCGELSGLVYMAYASGFAAIIVFLSLLAMTRKIFK